MLWTALVLGFLGSAHCIVMCGPLTMLLPQSKTKNNKLILAKVFYNFGRILTYAFIGLVIGSIGSQLKLFFSQKVLSIGIGVLILAVIVAYYSLKFQKFSAIESKSSKLKSWLKRTFNLSLFSGHFAFGVVNGFIPCGMVWAAAAGAFLLLDPVQSVLYMTLFGLGTFPTMLIATFSFHKIANRLRFSFKKLLPLSFTLLAFWLIFRGFSESGNFFGNDPNTKAVECIVTH